MANKKLNLNEVMQEKSKVRGSSLLKASIISTDDLANSLIEETLKKDSDKNTSKKIEENIDETITEITTTSTTSFSEVTNDVSFKTINDVQITYEPSEKGMIEKRYIDDINNNVLLRNTINEVKSLILKTNMDRYEMNDYFTDLIDNCIHERFKFIIRVGIDNNLSPNKIKTLLSGFVSDTEELDQDTVKDYIDEYMNFVCDIIYNRVKNNTFMIKELIAEALRLIDEESNDGISYIVNDLLYKAIDEKYIKLAKINIANRSPKHTMIMKDLKKRMQNK